jgi:hypothetical protein
LTRWAAYRIDDIGLALDVLADVAVEAELEPDAGRLLQWGQDVQIALWYGPDGTLERWASGMPPSAELGPEEAIVLACGLAARRRVARLPAERAEGGFATSDGGIELRVQEVPAREVMAVALVQDGIPVLASVTAPEDGREAAEHVLGSLRPA